MIRTRFVSNIALMALSASLLSASASAASALDDVEEFGEVSAPLTEVEPCDGSRLHDRASLAAIRDVCGPLQPGEFQKVDGGLGDSDVFEADKEGGIGTQSHITCSVLAGRPYLGDRRVFSSTYQSCTRAVNQKLYSRLQQYRGAGVWRNMSTARDGPIVANTITHSLSFRCNGAGDQLYRTRATGDAYIHSRWSGRSTNSTQFRFYCI